MTYEIARWVTMVVFAGLLGFFLGFATGEESEKSANRMYESSRQDIVRRTYIDGTGRFMTIIGSNAFECELVVE